MNTARFVHQQVFQLKWHVLACLGLIMILPLEETVVSLHDGDGLSYSATAATFWLAPLLAALVACATVQGDLDEKRDLFWRSKPVRVSQFVMGKFVIGLILCMIILVCPCAWMWMTTTLAGERLEGLSNLYVWGVAFVSFLAYSICFFCNVLIRKTARAWIIGLAVTCFALLIPLVLPLNYSDVYSNLFDVSRILWIYVLMILGIAALAFSGAVLAVKRNWQVHTHLRGLLWGAAGLIFAVILLFSRQIANIKILDEKAFAQGAQPQFVGGSEKPSLVYYGDAQKYCEISTVGDKIELIEQTETRFKPPSKQVLEEIETARSLAPEFDTHPELKRGHRVQSVHLQRGSVEYRLVFSTYHRTEPFIKESGAGDTKYIQERAYLRSYRLVQHHWIPAQSLDLSDHLLKDEWPRAVMGLAKDKAVVVLSETCLVIDVSDPQAMEVAEIKPYKGRHRYGPDERVQLIPADSLDIQDRIRLSIEMRGRIYREGRLHLPTNNENAGYIIVAHKGIAYYEVDRWDEKQVYARLVHERPYVAWEKMFGWISAYDDHFIRDGKLYSHSQDKLMVFDVGAKRIRKLGHYERLSQKYSIRAIEVDANGNILMLSQHEEGQGEDLKRTRFLQLLKNPE